MFDFLNFNEKYIKYDIIENLKKSHLVGSTNSSKKLEYLEENIQRTESKVHGYKADRED